jgi:hypothetical protein
MPIDSTSAQSTLKFIAQREKVRQPTRSWSRSC